MVSSGQSHARTLRQWGRGLVLFAACLGGGCIGTTRGLPLYGGDLPRDQIAQLIGPVRRVDGQSVPTGYGTFELLPGCHVVQIGGGVGSANISTGGGWAATLPPLTYAIRMRQGYTYTITFEREPSLGLGPVGYGDIVAREEDRDGHQRPLTFARDRADIAECQRWSPRQEDPSP